MEDSEIDFLIGNLFDETNEMDFGGSVDCDNDLELYHDYIVSPHQSKFPPDPSTVDCESSNLFYSSSHCNMNDKTSNIEIDMNISVNDVTIGNRNNNNFVSSSSSSSSSSSVISTSSNCLNEQEELPPIRSSTGEILSFETFQGNIDISKCIKMSLGNTDDGSDAEMEDKTNSTTSKEALSSSSSKKKRPRKPNPDSEMIAQATEQTLLMMDLDPNSKEGKRQRRRIRNRMSAQLHRERKKQYIEALENCIRERDIIINGLNQQIEEIKSNNTNNSNSNSSSRSDSSIATTVEFHSSNASVASFNTHITSASSSNDGNTNCDSDATPISMSGIGMNLEEADVEAEQPSRKHRRTEDMQEDGKSGVKQKVALFSGALFFLSLFSNAPTAVKINDDSNGASSSSYFSSSTSDGTLEIDKQVVPLSFGQVSPWEDTHTNAKDNGKVVKPVVTPSKAVQNLMNTKNMNLNINEGRQDLLWRYTDTDMIAVLYPTCAVNASTSSTSETKITKRNLRTGDKYSFSKVDSVSNTATSASSVSRQLVPVWQTSNSGSDINRRDLLSAEAMRSASSHILMTQGLANLDPSFAQKPLFLDVMRRASNSASAGSSDDLKEATNGPRVVSEKNERSRKASGLNSDSEAMSSLVPVPVVSTPASTTTATYSHPHPHQYQSHGYQTQHTQDQAASKELLMLIPASSVRFGPGANADNLDNSSLQSLLRQHNEKTRRENDTTGSMHYTTATEGEDETDLWVEIGCSVLSAKLVRNPALTTNASL